MSDWERSTTDITRGIGAVNAIKRARYGSSETEDVSSRV